MGVWALDIDAIISWGTEKMKYTDETPLERGYRYYHGLRTAKLALALAKGMGLEVSEDLLYIGGFLHDVGKAGYKGPDHGPRGAEIIEQEISHLFTKQELLMVKSIVANHYMRPNSKHFVGKERPIFSAEVQLIQDADTLDHFGANAVWLSFHWSTQYQRAQQDELDYYNTKDSQWRREAGEGLNYELSKIELQQRIELSDKFFSAWQKEELGLLTCLEENHKGTGERKP